MLHSDNGGPMKGAMMVATLQKLGVIQSFSRPSVSDDNPYSEALFRTMKYKPGYPSKPFQSIEEARVWDCSWRVSWRRLTAPLFFMSPAPAAAACSGS